MTPPDDLLNRAKSVCQDKECGVHAMLHQLIAALESDRALLRRIVEAHDYWLEVRASEYENGSLRECAAKEALSEVIDEAQRNGAKNGRDVVRLTDECAAKGIVLVPGGENL